MRISVVRKIKRVCALTIRSSTLPENFITVQQSEISRPDSSTNNRVTFRIEFTAPANELVGEHNITFSFTDTDGNIQHYMRGSLELRTPMMLL